MIIQKFSFVILMLSLFAFDDCKGAVGQNDRIKVIVSDDDDNIYVSVFNNSRGVISVSWRFSEGFIESGSDIEMLFAPIGDSKGPMRFSGGEPRFADADDVVPLSAGKSIGGSFPKCFISRINSLSDGEYYLTVRYSPVKWVPGVDRIYYASGRVKVKMKSCTEAESGIFPLGAY